MQMWSLYVVPNFTFKFVHSTFIFSFQNFMSECFLYFFPPKFILIIFYFLQILSYEFYFHIFLYKSLYLNISVQVSILRALAFLPLF